MELFGLGATQLLTLFGVVGASAVALYLLKLRRRRVEVPFVHLWESVLADQKTTRLFSQLKRILSLLLTLLLLGGIVLALGDPRPESAAEDARTLVVLLDSSASMKSEDIAPNRFETAREKVEELIAGLGPADRMLLVALGGEAKALGPMSGDRDVLRDALERAEPLDVAARLDRGLALARDALRGARGAEVVVVTDGSLELAEGSSELLGDDVALTWERVGVSDANVAITSLAVRRYPLDKSQTEVLLEVWNPTDRERTVELELRGDGASIDVQRLHLAAGERLRRFFENVSGADATLEARVSPADGEPDHLATDDRGHARLPERRRSRILVVTAGNLYLEAALLLDEYLEVTQISPQRYRGTEGHDVVIFDDWVPDQPPEAPALYLHPAPREGVEGPLEVVGTLESPYFDRLEREHPLLRWTALRDVNVAEALSVRLREGDEEIAGDRDGSLIVEGTREGQPFVAMTFDVRRSDLPLRVAWPLLLLNTIETFVQQESGFHSSYETGTTWRIPVASGATEATIVDPAGEEHRVPVIDGRAVFEGTSVGFHTVRALGEEEVVAANLGPGEESRIEPATDLVVRGRPAASLRIGDRRSREHPWVYVIAAVALMLIFEWVSYHRRWTV